MKRFFNFALVLLTAAGLASCQRFEDEAILPDAYSVIVNTAETRTANEGYNTVWSSGDEMTMFWKSSKGNPHFGKFSYTSGSTFTTEESVGSSAYRWYGVYPYSDSNTSYTEVSASIPASQTQNGNDSMAHLAGSGFPLWGRTDDYVPSGNTPVFTAHQVATVLKYVVTNTGETPVTVTKIQFSAPTAIAGACKANLTSDNVVWQPSSSNTSQAVTLNVTNGSTIKNGESASFFVGAIPFSETGEYTVNVYATDGENNYVYTNKVTGNFVAKSGKINTIPLSFVPGDPVAGVTGYELVTSEPLDWSGSYLIVDVAKAKLFTGETSKTNFYTLDPSDFEGDVITNPSLSQYAFTITKNGNNFYLKQGNNYYSVNWTNSSTGIVTSTSQKALSYGGVLPSGAFLFYGVDQSKNQYLYVKSSEGYFKFGGSGSDTGILLYKYTEGATPIDPPAPGGEKVYTKVTSAPTDWSGTYLIVDESARKAFDEKASSYASNVTISDGKIAWSETVAKYEVTVSPSSVSGMYDLKTVSGNYMYSYNNGKDTWKSSNKQSSNTYYNSLSISGGNVTMYSTRTGTGSPSVNYFGYESSASNNPNSKNFGYKDGATTRTVQFYKLSEGGDEPATKQDQNLSFTKSSKTINSDTFTLGNGTYIAPTLIGAMTTPVTWTSSKTSVATVSNGGIVTIVAAGTTTITASAPASDTYNEASASYELTVSPAQGQPTTKTYTKVSTITAGRNYVIAHSNNALQNNDGSAKAFSISGKVSNNTLTLTASDASSLEWKASASSSTKGEFKFANGGTYAYRESNTNVIKLSASAEEDRSAWTLSGTQLYNINSGGSNYYLNYSGTQWQATTGGSSAAITVYEENDGSTPDTPDTPTEKAYIKVTSAPSDWSGTYLIVDESARKAFDEKASSYASNVTISDGKIAWSETVAKYEVTVSPSSVSGMYDLKTVSGNYMYSYNNGKDTWKSSNKQSSNTYYNSLSISGGNVTMYSTRNGTGTPSVNYFGYESSASNNPNSKNFGYKDGATTRTVQLYKLNGESTPSTPDTPSEPTPDGTTFNLENSTLKTYLDAAEINYSNSTSKSIMSSYLGSGNSRDLPNPVSLKWSGSATSVSIYEGNSTSGTPVKTMSFNSSTSADVYNLIPGKTYTYSTSNGQTGTFTTIGRRRMIKVSDEVSQNHARNCRDLGGVKTRKGETLNYGLMYRGTNMDSVTDKEKAILVNELGIKLDQDLRGSSRSPIGVAISGEKYDANTIQNQNGDNMKTTVSDVMNAVIKGDPVYIHCQIGSDRTGHMCMLYLALLGCDLKECDIDYEITSFASAMTGGTRTIGSGNEASFRSKFIKSPYDNNSVPEAVENYVVNTLKISLDTVKKFRKAMGVSETLN